MSDATVENVKDATTPDPSADAVQQPEPKPEPPKADPLDVAKHEASREAAKYRVAKREAEKAAQIAQQQLHAARVQIVSNSPAFKAITPSALKDALDGMTDDDLSKLFDPETGNVDDEAASKWVGDLLERKPYMSGVPDELRHAFYSLAEEQSRTPKSMWNRLKEHHQDYEANEKLYKKEMSFMTSWLEQRICEMCGIRRPSDYSMEIVRKVAQDAEHPSGTALPQGDALTRALRRGR